MTPGDPAIALVQEVLMEESKMDQELKAKWLTALRSGEYEQGKGALCTVDHGDKRFCCLGVLADVAGEPWIDASHPAERSVGVSRFGVPRNGDTYHVYVGVPPHGFHGLSGQVMRKLWLMNDGEGVARRLFGEIADWIEANL